MILGSLKDGSFLLSQFEIPTRERQAHPHQHRCAFLQHTLFFLALYLGWSVCMSSLTALREIFLPPSGSLRAGVDSAGTGVGWGVTSCLG